MKDKHRKALLKIAQNPGFFDSFQNWGQSLFDGKSGTSLPHFNNMMKSDAMNNVSSSFNAFTDKAGRFANTFNDGKTGTTWDAFKNMYTGEGAPWAWGTTALAAATMANAFNNGGNNGGGNSGGGGFGLGSLLGLGALGLGAYALYKAPEWINNIKATHSSVNNLKSTDPQKNAAELRRMSANPSHKKWVQTAVDVAGTPEQQDTYYQHANVAPILQMTDPRRAKQGLEHVSKNDKSFWRRWGAQLALDDPDMFPGWGSDAALGVVNETNDASVVSPSVKANNRLNRLGYNDPVVNNASMLTTDTLRSHDSKNVDNRALEELKLLGQLKLSPEAYNKQYKAIVDRSNQRKQGTKTNDTTKVNLTNRNNAGVLRKYEDIERAQSTGITPPVGA